MIWSEIVVGSKFAESLKNQFSLVPRGRGKAWVGSPYLLSVAKNSACLQCLAADGSQAFRAGVITLLVRDRLVCQAGATFGVKQVDLTGRDADPDFVPWGHWDAFAEDAHQFLIAKP